MAPSIRELSPALLDDYLAFFDTDAFADNPEWQGCYCRFMQVTGGDKEAWNSATPEGNRVAVAEKIARGDMHGLLAYEGGKPVAWCQATVPAELESMAAFLRMERAPGPDTGVVTCFVVAAAHRGQGLARQLLAAAEERFRRLGLAFIEAYPPKQCARAADAYPGSLALYEQAGFERAGELERRWIVRKKL